MYWDEITLRFCLLIKDTHHPKIILLYEDNIPPSVIHTVTTTKKTNSLTHMIWDKRLNCDFLPIFSLARLLNQYSN